MTFKDHLRLSKMTCSMGRIWLPISVP